MQGTLNQPYVALLCVYLGMGGMLAYCLLRRLGSLLHLGRVGRMLVEFLFCLGFACFCAWVFYCAAKFAVAGILSFGHVAGCIAVSLWDSCTTGGNIPKNLQIWCKIPA